MKTTRTHKSLKNAKIALFFYAVNLVMQFFSRKIFLDYLGAEVLGLNTTMANVMQFLNLAELGIGTAVAVTLYRPLASGNRKQISDLVSLQGALYRKIAYITTGAALLLMCFFPFFFAKAEVPLWYTYATFSVMLYGMLGGYVFNFNSIVLSADQKEYRSTIPVQSIKTVKTLLQLFLIMSLPHSYGYIAWLVLEFLATTAIIYAVNRTVKKEYPWLKTDIKRGRELRLKYPDILVKTKQLIFHKVAGFALSQTTPVIIYAYASFTLVAIYGNYMLIVQGIMMLVHALYNAIDAGIGNLVAESEKGRVMRVFREFFSSRFLLSATVCFGVYVLATPFITIWVGSQYLLDNISLILIVITLFINISRGAVDTFINAYGLYQDIWAPITEAILDLGLALLLGWFWGLPGILAGVLIGLFSIIFIWKPYLLFRKGFRAPVRSYIAMYAKHAAIMAVVFVIISFLMRYVPIDPAQSIASLVVYTVIVVGGFGLLLGLSLFAVEKGMRDFVDRVLYILRR